MRFTQLHTYLRNTEFMYMFTFCELRYACALNEYTG